MSFVREVVKEYFAPLKDWRFWAVVAVVALLMAGVFLSETL